MRSTNRMPIGTTTAEAQLGLRERRVRRYGPEVSRLVLPMICSLCILLASHTWANDIIKADNATALNLSGSWVSGGPPGSGDTAVINSTLTAGSSAALGGSMAWMGIRVA